MVAYVWILLYITDAEKIDKMLGAWQMSLTVALHKKKTYNYKTLTAYPFYDNCCKNK